MKLRPYQKESLKLTRKSLKKNDHVLFGGATGFGKSVIILALVKKELKKGGKIVVLAPRRKLVRQLAETLEQYSPSIIMGTDTMYDENSKVFICSIPTMNNKLKTGKKKYFGDVTLVLQDEIHMSFDGKSMDLFKNYYWDDAKWVGLSATPIDSGGYRLEGWDETIYKYQTQDLISLGYLTPMKVMVEDRPEGLDDVGMVGGDYNEGQLSEFMSDDARVNNVYAIWKKYCQKRRTMIFAVSISHADIIYQDFLRHDVKVGIVHSGLDESEEDHTLEALKHGDIDVIVNVGKLTTGFDEPAVNALIMARPTKSLRLFIQMVGRALRIKKGKKDALFLDLAGTVDQFGYPTMRRDFNRIRPTRSETTEIIFKDMICPHCDYEAQYRNCRKETIETEHHITKRVYCMNCDEIMDETVTETKEIERLKLVEDYTNISKVKNKDVGMWLEKLSLEADYKPQWLHFVSIRYKQNQQFQNAVKLLYNRYEAGLIQGSTALQNVNKLQKES